MVVIRVALDQPLTVQPKLSTTTITEAPPPPQDTTMDTEVAPATDLIPFWATVATGDTAAVDITINSDTVGVTICPQR